MLLDIKVNFSIRYVNQHHESRQVVGLPQISVVQSHGLTIN